MSYGETMVGPPPPSPPRRSGRRRRTFQTPINQSIKTHSFRDWRGSPVVVEDACQGGLDDGACMRHSIFLSIFSLLFVGEELWDILNEWMDERMDGGRE